MFIIKKNLPRTINHTFMKKNSRMPPAQITTETFNSNSVPNSKMRLEDSTKQLYKIGINANNNLVPKAGTISEEDDGAPAVSHRSVSSKDTIDNPPLEIVNRNILLFVYLHLAALYGFYIWVTGHVMLQTFFWGFLLYCMCGFGITAGAHRLWSHRAYKAKLPLRIILCICQTVAFQNHIHEWVRDHRVHHKFSETAADPHNATRGFFFAHMGWLMCRKDKSVKEKGKCIDMSDLEQDAVVVFQRKYYLPLVLSACFIIPSVVPWYFWKENFWTAFFFCAQFRYCITLHMTWLVNSAAHIYGNRPYDVNIGPRENRTVSFWAFGEGWHNYHHVFPWDYKVAEVGVYKYNFSAAFIDLFARIGWAYDLKTVAANTVLQRVSRTGDGSYVDSHHKPGPWGWGDKDISDSNRQLTRTLYTLKEE